MGVGSGQQMHLRALSSSSLVKLKFGKASVNLELIMLSSIGEYALTARRHGPLAVAAERFTGELARPSVV